MNIARTVNIIRGCLVVATVIFQHLELITVLGYAVTLGLLTGLLLLATTWTHANWPLLALVLSAVVVLSTANTLLSGYDEPGTFAGTFALFLLSSTIFVLGASSPLSSFIGSKAFEVAVFVSLTAVVSLSVVQTLTGALDIDFFFNPFREAQFGYQYNPDLLFVTFARAEGFFLEPSYDAFVIGTLGVILLSLTPRRRIAILALTVSGLVATQSAIGLGLLAVGAVIAVVRAVSRARARYIWASVAVVALLAVLIAPTLIRRLSTLADVGSSANYRILAPLPVLRDVLAGHPLGMPPGSVYEVVASYDLQMFGVEQTQSLDNGFYVLIYYFGVIGILLIVALLVWVIRALLARRPRGESDTQWIAPFWLVGSLIFSGGIMAPEFALMTWLVLMAYRHAQPQESDLRRASALGHHGDSSRSRWRRTHPEVAGSPG